MKKTILLRVVWWVVGVLAVLVIVAVVFRGPLTRIVLLRYKRFHEVIPGALYRSALPNTPFLDFCVDDQGIKTILTLSGDVTPPYSNLFVYLDECPGVTHVHLPMYARVPPTLEQAQTIMRVFDDTNARPVLVHCHHGIDRTGYAVALHRVLREGWSIDDSLDEALRMGMSETSYKMAVESMPGLVAQLTNGPVAETAAGQ
jgi:protein tyrosine/serine phosphatase